MILCVDPDEGVREATRDALQAEGFETVGAGTVAAAADHLGGSDDVDCLVTEQPLPDGTGLELIDRTRDVAPDTACILYTDRPIDDIETDSFGGTIAEYLRKDAGDAERELVAVVEHSLSFLSQTAYPLPTDEDARVAALERYATDPDALSDSLDRLTELATVLFDVDSAAVGLIDAHDERFLACYGASFDELNREDTICTYTILDDDVTVIEDVTTDPRFSENEVLAADDIRFYAGASLVTPSGHAIGTFCLHDAEPRPFPSRDRELLRSLADEAMDQLELRRRLRGGDGDDD